MLDHGGAASCNGSRVVRFAVLAIATAFLMAFSHSGVSAQTDLRQVTQAEPRDFDIPAQPLTEALIRFGRQAGLQTTAEADLVQGLRSAPVRGAMTWRQALDRMLAGTGLSYRLAGSMVTVERPAVQEDTGGAVQLAPVRVQGKAESAYGPVTGYKASRSATATRTDTPILETPTSIQVIPQDVIRDQTPRRLRDVFRNVSGIQSAFTGFNVASLEEPVIRGFEDSNIYRNGFRTSRVIAPLEFANVERVEVLKGPASVLFGLAEPGGLVNIVTKRPFEERVISVEQEFGSYERFRTTVDANTPLAEDKSLLGRMNLAYTSDDTFRDHDGIQRFFIAPSLTWRPSAATELIFEASYSYDKHPFDHGIAFSAAGEPVADVATFLGEPDFRSEREEIFAGYTLTHSLSDQLRIRNVTTFNYTKNRLNGFRHFSAIDPATDTVDRSFNNTDQKGTAIQTLADVGYDFDIGATRHETLFGLDLRFEPKFGNGSNGPRSNGPFPINGLHPQFGLVGAIPNDNPVDSENETTWIGVYAQNQVKLLDDRLHVLIGGRYDYVDQSVKFITPGFELVGDRQDEAFTGRIGALYELTDWLSPYVNVSRSFNPVSPFTVGDVAPTTGFQTEGGLKLNFFDERLAATFAVYEIIKDNVPVADLANPGFSLNGGELRSRGFEVDIAGALAPGWQIIANYALMDTKVLKSDTLPVGSRFRNVPTHSGSVWMSYEFQRESGLEGLGFGGGVSGAGERLGDNAGSFDLDGYFVADAALWYRADVGIGGRQLPVKAQLNVQNLFDKEYYESSDSKGNVFPGASRTIIGSVSVTF